MDALRRLAGWLDRLVTLAGSVAIVGLMLVIGGTVIYRWLGGTFQGSYELAEAFTIVTITMAVLMATIRRQHVDVRLVTDQMPPGVRRTIAVVLGFLAAGFWGLVFWSAFLRTSALSVRGEITPVLGINIVPFRWVITLGALAVALVLLYQALRALVGNDAPDTGITHEP